MPRLPRASVLPFSLTASLAACLLAGCGVTSVAPTAAPVRVAGIGGTIYGGQQPITGALVSVYAVGATGYNSAGTLLATTTSDADGNFQFAQAAYTCPAPTTQVYITAAGGNSGGGVNPSIMLTAGLGNCSSAKTQFVQINEVSTAVTAFALSHFFTSTLGSASSDGFGGPASSPGLTLSNTYTIPTLLNLATGYLQPSTAQTTIEAQKIYSIANTIAACVNSTGNAGGACTTFFTDTTPPGGTTPTDTLQAAVQMALYPYQNVTALYTLAPAASPFVGLPSTPNDWTIAVSYKTPTLGLGISGAATQGTSANIDIDQSGRVWVPSNLPGAAGVGYFDPTSASFSGPFNAAGSAAVAFPQYLSIDQTGDVWVTDQNTGNLIAINTANNALDFTASVGGATGGPIATDYDNQIEFSSIAQGQGFLSEITADRTALNAGVNNFDAPTTSLSPVYDGTAGDRFVVAAASGVATPCFNDVAEYSAAQGYDYGYFAVTTNQCESGGSAATVDQDDAVIAASTLNQLCSALDGCFAPRVPVSLPQGIAVDGVGALWVANAGNGSVSTLFGTDNGFGAGAGRGDYAASSTVAYLHGANNGGTMTTPYGVAVDGSGNVWIANASCVTTGATQCTPGALVLSELIGAAAPALTPLSLQNAEVGQGHEPDVTMSRGRAKGAGSDRLKALKAASNLKHGYALHLPASISAR